MANSISLSTDMKTLYFTDSSGFTTSFKLDELPNGVYISSIMGNVIVIVAPSPLSIGNDDYEIGITSQWDISFHENSDQAIIVGSDDIEGSSTAQVFKYDLDKGKALNLRLNSTQTKILART